ncbi:hypothetical protein OsI_21050 [Oryza sativa Indica Group]|jgi:F-box interacting protein|uniref:F-box domain-containing protein n=2 Tax=Oryza TaxID=4527 RepID=A0A0E0HIQ5_ORYNI|nr:hypothetical protein OsI_21050 [Oryza sativa Indica Group]
MAAICGETISVDELWREILLRAPTKDVARSCCVSTQWRGIVRDPSFRKLHHDRYAVPSKDDVPDALLVITVDADGQSVSAVVPAMVSPVSTSQRAPMYRVIKNGISYSLANVCNGFLCFASWSRAKVVVCNPITGEKRAIPRAPPIGPDYKSSRARFVLGFSPTTHVYKLFRFADRRIDVYTLPTSGEAGGGGWRQLPLLYPCTVVETTPSVVVGGKICVMTATGTPSWHPPEIPTLGPVLVVDVASEKHRMYSPPDNGCPAADETSFTAFELHGRLCLAIRISMTNTVQFWTLSVEEDDDDDDDLPWQLLYTIKIDMKDGYNNGFQELEPMNDWFNGGYNGFIQVPEPMDAWLDGETHTLCYREGSTLYSRYIGTTTTQDLSLTEVMSWDSEIYLPEIPNSLQMCN